MLKIRGKSFIETERGNRANNIFFPGLTYISSYCLLLPNSQRPLKQTGDDTKGLIQKEERVELC